ncbi:MULTISPECIES: P-loop NTPase fold protein [Acidobacterium]|uniref:KAP family P-loop domain protein n=1 Tax=Acidobacterium capsulatum (strain ATCC 51196 / DSM 11244 / BCRC 80197 / JCM 7670 / NBRC 15755 / NCIMB 13165 / 161) TaxID=240015 RepID=C1F6Q2_ACIC5|nr:MULTISPECIES: P-loop NTPase fold protein [Acidobacterium]ACO32901.1 KAP family P-loop domain protein [Acidobacterium capsulatum ATCC 51196]HCT60946.1 hypothetical protein [Acidobacterium sp.]
MEREGEEPSPSQWLSADRPIRSRSEDELGRRGFSEALADAIRGWSGQESLVIALYGPWGNGKSSVKNMAVEALDQSSPRIRCVEFNPWQMAIRPSLSEAFFDELGIALGKGDLGSEKQRKRTLNTFKRWALRLRGPHDLAKATRNVVGALLILVGLAAFGSAWLHSKTFAFTFGILALVIALLAFTTGLVEATIKLLAAGIDVGQKSINEIKEKLAQDLKRLKTPIVVVLDDLDRLTPQETLEVFQLIKSNADFPNTVYLTICERSIVESNISSVLKVSGSEYLEKIVQVAFDVPLIDIERVRRILFDRLNQLLVGEAVSKHFNTTRWANIFWSGVHAYFSTLRDVNRFVSTLAFQFSSFFVDGAFEVNPIDLIALEVLRLNEPVVYRALQSSKEVLTSHKSNGRDTEEAKQSLNSIVEAGSNNHQNEITEILKHLFPATERAFGGPSYSAEFGARWYRELRVCSPKLFDRYFRLAVNAEELPQATVQKLLAARGDRSELTSILGSLATRGLLVLALEELAICEDELGAEQVEAYLAGIFDTGDKIPETRPAGFEIPIQWRIGFLVQHALEKIEKADARAAALVNAIDVTSGLTMAIEVADILTAKSAEEGSEPFLSGADASDVQAAALRKMEAAASSGALARSPRVASLLHIWHRWGEPGKAAAFAEGMSNTPEGILALLKSLELRSTVRQVGDRAATERYYFQRTDFEPLISLDKLNEKVNALPAETLDEQGNRLVRNFHKMLERRDAGQPDSGPFAFD